MEGGGLDDYRLHFTRRGEKEARRQTADLQYSSLSHTNVSVYLCFCLPSLSLSLSFLFSMRVKEKREREAYYSIRLGLIG